MQHSPTHYHHGNMFVFTVIQIVWPELAPPVYVRSSLPVLYIFYCSTKRYEICWVSVCHYWPVRQSSDVIMAELYILNWPSTVRSHQSRNK